MEGEENSENKVHDVPGKVFVAFIEELETIGVEESVVASLEKAIITDQNCTEHLLRIALFNADII